MLSDDISITTYGFNWIVIMWHMKDEIINLLSQLDSMFDNIDCSMDCPCHSYCDNNVGRALCTVVTLALGDMKDD